VRLPRLLKTSSFRLTVLYSGLFGLSVLILFVIIYLSTAGYMSRQFDEAVNAELAELRSEAEGGGLSGLAAAVKERVARASTGSYYLLRDASGRILAGNLSGVPPVIGFFSDPQATEGDGAGEPHGLRGRGIRVAGGADLIVARDSFQLEEMRELIARAFLWSGLTTVVLAVVGGAVMSAGLLRRVETVSRTSRAIIDGNLAQRVPLRGADDEFDLQRSSP